MRTRTQETNLVYSMNIYIYGVIVYIHIIYSVRLLGVSARYSQTHPNLCPALVP